MTCFKNVRTLFLLLPLVYLVSCGQFVNSPDTVDVSFDIINFDQIKVDAPYSVEVIQSDEYKIVVTCDEKIADVLDVSKEGKTLHLGLSHAKRKIKVLSAKVYLPTLKKLDLSGAVKIHLPQFNTEKLEIISSGAVKIVGNVTLSQELIIDGSGANNIDLEGSTQNATITFSGANDFNGKEFVVEKTLNVNITGASTVNITANGDLFVDLSGASKLNYTGRGSVQKKSISGASKLNGIKNK